MSGGVTSHAKRLPFTFQAVGGLGRLALVDLAVGPLVVDRLELEVSDLGTDPGSTRAERFQRRRTRLRSLAARLTAHSLDERVAQIKKPLAGLGITALAARLSDGFVSIRARAADGLAAADLSFRIQLVSAGSHLRALASTVRVHGHLPTPGPVIADRILSALLGATDVPNVVERPHVRGLCDVEIDLIGALLWHLMPPSGWRLPAVTDIELVGIKSVRGSIEIGYGPAGTRSGELGVRPATHALAAAHDTMHSVDEQLREGHLEDAMRGYRALLAAGGPDQPLLLERILALAGARPAWFFDGLELARQALGRWPQFAAAHAALASITLAQGDAREAASHLMQIAQLASADGDDDQAALAALAGARLLRVLEPRSATQLYQLALEHDPSSAEAADSLADRLADEQRWTELVRLVRARAATAEPARAVQLRLRLADVFVHQLGDPAGAQTELLAARELAPDDPAVHEMTATILSSSDPSAAVDAWREVARLAEARGDHRTCARAWAILGDLLAKGAELHGPSKGPAEDTDAGITAVHAWKRALELDPLQADALVGLAQAAAAKGEHADAAELYERLRGVGLPQFAAARHELALARSLVALDRLDDARTSLRRATMAGGETAAEAHAVLAEIAEATFDREHAAAELDTAIASLVDLAGDDFGDDERLMRRAAQLAIARAGLLDRHGQPAAASADYQRAHELAQQHDPELARDAARTMLARAGDDAQTERRWIDAVLATRPPRGERAALLVERADIRRRERTPDLAAALADLHEALQLTEEPDEAADPRPRSGSPPPANRTGRSSTGDAARSDRRARTPSEGGTVIERPAGDEASGRIAADGAAAADVATGTGAPGDLAVRDVAEADAASGASTGASNGDEPLDTGHAETAPSASMFVDIRRRAYQLEAELLAQSGDQRARAQALAALARMAERAADRVEVEMAAAAAWLAADEPAAALPHGARAHAELDAGVPAALRREVLVTLGEAAWRQRAWPDVIRAYRGLIDDPGAETPRLGTFRYRLAVAADRSGEQRLALETLQPLVVDLDAARAINMELRGQALRLYADLAERAGELAGSATALEAFAALSLDSSTTARADAMYRAGELFRRAERGEDAIRCLEAALRISDTHLPALDALETAWRERGDLERVSVILGRKVAATGRHPARQKPLLSRLGDLQDQLGRPDVALATHQRALEIDPAWRPSLRYVSLRLRDTGQLVPAAGGLAQLAGDLPGDAGVDLAMVANERKLAATALAELVMTLDDAQLDAVRDVARPALERASVEGTDVAAAVARVRGEAAPKPSVPERAEEDTQSGRVSNQQAGALSLRDAAARARAAGKLDDALATLETANHVSPGDAGVLRELVDIATELGQHDVAAQHLQALADKASGARRGDALLELADICYDKLEDAAAGRRAMRAAAEAFGTGARRDATLRLLANEASTHLAWEIAAEALAAIPIHRRTTTDVVNLASALQRAGRDADAIASIEVATEAKRFDDGGVLLQRFQHESDRKSTFARTLEIRAGRASNPDDADAMRAEARELREAIGEPEPPPPPPPLAGDDLDPSEFEPPPPPERRGPRTKTWPGHGDQKQPAHATPIATPSPEDLARTRETTRPPPVSASRTPTPSRFPGVERTREPTSPPMIAQTTAPPTERTREPSSPPTIAQTTASPTERTREPSSPPATVVADGEPGRTREPSTPPIGRIKLVSIPAPTTPDPAAPIADARASDDDAGWVSVTDPTIKSGPIVVLPPERDSGPIDDPDALLQKPRAQTVRGLASPERARTSSKPPTVSGVPTEATHLRSGLFSASDPAAVRPPDEVERDSAPVIAARAEHDVDTHVADLPDAAPDPSDAPPDGPPATAAMPATPEPSGPAAIAREPSGPLPVAREPSGPIAETDRRSGSMPVAREPSGPIAVEDRRGSGPVAAPEDEFPASRTPSSSGRMVRIVDERPSGPVKMTDEQRIPIADSEPEGPSVVITGSPTETANALAAAAASADRDRLLEAHRAAPDDPALLLALLAHLGDRAPGLRRQILEDVVRDSTGRALAIALHELALQARELRDSARTAALLGRAFDVDPTYAPAWLPLAEIRASANDITGARALFQRVADSPEYDATRRAFAQDRSDALAEDEAVVSGTIRPPAEAALARVETLADSGDIQSAIREAESVAREMPANVEALELLERLYLESGDVTAASEAIGRQLVVVEDPASRAKLWRRRARLYRDALGRDAEAYRCLKEAHASNPDDAEISYQLRTAAMVRGEWALAASLLYREITAAPSPRDKGALHLELALIYEERLDDDAQAQVNYEQALAFDPSIPAAKLPLARRYEAIGRHAEAARLFEESAATARAGDRAALLDAATKARAAATERDGEPDLAAQLDRAEAAGDLDAALDLAHQLWRQQPGHQAAFRVLANVHRASGDLAALTELTSVRASQADTPEERATAWLEVARLAEDVGALDQAARAYDLALIEDPGHVGALDARGALAFRLGDFATADLIYRDLGPGESVLGDDELALRRSIIAEQLGRDTEALAHAKNACAAAPGRRDIVVRVQELATRIGDLETALNAARLVLDLVPLDDDDAQLATHFALVDLQRQAGDLDGAISALERILRDQPLHSLVLEQLADLHIARGDWVTATRYLYQLVPLAPSPPERAERLYRLGEAVLTHLGDTDRADDVFLRASDLDPTHVPTLRRLLDVYWRADDPGALVEVATELADKGALATGPTLETSLAHALVAAALVGDTALAQRLSNALGDEAPQRVAAALAELLGREGRLQIGNASTAIAELARRGMLDIAKVRSAAAGTPVASILAGTN